MANKSTKDSQAIPQINKEEMNWLLHCINVKAKFNETSKERQIYFKQMLTARKGMLFLNASKFRSYKAFYKKVTFKTSTIKRIESIINNYNRSWKLYYAIVLSEEVDELIDFYKTIAMEKIDEDLIFKEAWAELIQFHYKDRQIYWMNQKKRLMRLQTNK